MPPSDDSPEPEPDPPTSPSATGELLKRLAAHGAASPRYKLEGEIARGGMGAILRVWDEDVRRHLAMKVILGKAESGGEHGTPQVDARTLARFLEEGQVTGQLDHPGIVPVHELGLDADGRVYFTMKLVKGRDLRQIFELVFAAAEGWTQTRALGVVLKACEALAYAHKKGVIHRDLKPANVMVGNFGEVYVMDWGLARVLDRKDTHDIRLAPEFTTGLTSVHSERREERDDAPDSPLVTMDGDVMGTPAYMPPEQARGEIEKLSPRSDIYSIGALLYHLLARQLPFVPPGVRMTNRTVLARLLEGPPRALHEIRPEVPAELVAICEKAMAREAERRYPDTLALAEDLQAFLEGRVVHAYETGAVAELRKWVARNKGIALASAAALLVALGGLAWVSLVQSGARRAIGDNNTELEKTNAALARAKTTAETNERLAKEQSYVANIAAADASLRANELAEATRRLEACDEHLRGWEWKRLKLAMDSSQAVLRGHEDVVASVAFSPDGTLLASSSWDKTVRLWEVASRECRFVLRGHKGPVSGVAFSRDGGRIASSSFDCTVRVWNATDGATLRVCSAGTQFLDSVTFSPDGARVAAHAEDGVLEWNAINGELLPTGRGPILQGFSSVAYSPDGACIAAGALESVCVRKLDSSADPSTLVGHGNSVTSVAYSPDGACIASGAGDSTLRVWSASSCECLLVLHGHLAGVESVAFAPDGGHLASGSSDNTVRLWSTAREQDALVLAAPRAVRPAVAFSPDGARIAVASDGGGACLWDSRSVEKQLGLEDTWFDPEKELLGPPSVAFSPDGSRIAAAELHESVRIWSAIDGKALLDLRGHEKSVGGVAFSPDGTEIVTASADLTIRLWNSTSGESLRVLRGHTGAVNSAVFSPDGARIASASDDKTVRLWDAATGAVLLELHGHDQPVCAAAFSPDGSRIASASEDKTLRVWSVTSGECLLVLRGHAEPVYCVAFSPDGARIASASHDKTVRIWDAASGESLIVLRGHSEAVRSVCFSPDGSRLASAASDSSVRVRETSASVAQDPARSAVAAAASLVQSLFEPLLLAENVEQRLRADTSLPDAVRSIALRLVRVHGNDSEALNKASWNIVKLPHADRESCERALRAMHAVCDRRPDDGLMLNTLGVAQYRLGRFAEALATLTRSDELNQRKQPGDVAFLAMAQQQLGHTQAAQAELTRLRELMQDPQWTNDAEAPAFVAEAEALLAGAK